MLQSSTLQFLKTLKKNNNKPWFDSHRPAYESAKQDVESFITDVLKDLSKTDEQVANLKAKECMFRINRDVRFSKDKSPYKTNFGASIKRNGKKSIYAGYYFHAEPGMSFTGGGMWMPEPDAVKKVRQEISYCYDEFQKIVGSKKFRSVYGDLDRDEEFTLVNLPKGYEKDDPAASYLKLKCWIATRPITDEEIKSKGLKKIVVDAMVTLQPLLQFINRAVED